MIRDPSDGSTKPSPSEDLLDLMRAVAKKPRGPDMDHEPTRKVLAGETSGLPTGSQKEKNLARLEKSREWLVSYYKNRGTK